jgi:hypothetical protein
MRDTFCTSEKQKSKRRGTVGWRESVFLGRGIQVFACLPLLIYTSVRWMLRHVLDCG